MKKAIIFGCLVMLVFGCVVVGGCGSSGNGSSVEGVYKLEAGDSVAAVLTLKADNKATYSLTDDGGGIPLTYEVKDGTVVLIGADGKELPDTRFTIEEDGLRDATGNIYKKQ